MKQDPAFTKALLRKTLAKRAFSLVEVAVALSIVAFSCVTMLGLLPAGLNSFHQAMGNMAESQIVQGLTENMSLAAYANVSSTGNANNAQSFLNQPTYYDAEGIATNAGSTGYIYKATVVASDLNNSPALQSQSSGQAVTLTGNYGSATVIQIVSINQPGLTNYFPVVLANQGY